jgi:hypothetical protein
MQQTARLRLFDVAVTPGGFFATVPKDQFSPPSLTFPALRPLSTQSARYRAGIWLTGMENEKETVELEGEIYAA